MNSYERRSSMKTSGRVEAFATGFAVSILHCRVPRWHRKTSTVVVKIWEDLRKRTLKGTGQWRGAQGSEGVSERIRER